MQHGSGAPAPSLHFTLRDQLRSERTGPRGTSAADTAEPISGLRTDLLLGWVEQVSMRALNSQSMWLFSMIDVPTTR